MATTVKHAFVNPHADGPDATRTRPSNWNALHVLEGLAELGASVNTFTGRIAAPQVGGDGTSDAAFQFRNDNLALLLKKDLSDWRSMALGHLDAYQGISIVGGTFSVAGTATIDMQPAVQPVLQEWKWGTNRSAQLIAMGDYGEARTTFNVLYQNIVATNTIGRWNNGIVMASPGDVSFGVEVRRSAAGNLSPLFSTLAYAGQTANAQEWRDVNSAPRAKVTADGSLAVLPGTSPAGDNISITTAAASGGFTGYSLSHNVGAGPVVSNWTADSAGVRFGTSSAHDLAIRRAGSEYVNLTSGVVTLFQGEERKFTFAQNSGNGKLAFNTNSGTYAHFAVPLADLATSVAFRVRANAAQSAHIQDWEDNNGVPLAWVTAAGVLTSGTIAATTMQVGPTAGNGGPEVMISSGATDRMRLLALAGQSYIQADDPVMFAEIGGTTARLQIEPDTYADTETALLVRRRVGGGYSTVRVSMGAVDSGGSGFKVLRVPN